ncbi:MAG TPA: GGDEF domain-containing protein [Pirellulales bacterium]|nr:GGDEF domain-containing protein [Pirellulales bacterium]
MVFFVLCVAILNLGLGYGLGLYLHSHTGPRPCGASKALSFGLRLLSLIKDREEKLDDSAPAAGESENENAMTASTPTFVADRSSLPAPKPSTSPVVDPPPPEAASSAEPSVKELPSFETARAFEALAAAAPRSGDRLGEAPSLEAYAEVDEEAIAAAIEGLRSELQRYRGEIAAVDARLHDCAMAPDELTVRSCADQLRGANLQYLEQQESRRERFATDSTSGEAATAVRELVNAADRQAMAVAAAQAALAKLDQETDLLVQCQQMLVETRQISQSSEELQTTIGATRAIILHEAADLPPIGSAASETGRGALEAQLDRWRKSAAASNSRFSVAMIDPDQLGQLNEQHGRAVVDRALDVFDRIAQFGLQPGQIAARSKAQCRLLFLPGVALREAVKVVERCRQQIDATQFQCEEKPLRLTVSCAVALTDRTEAAAALIARLEAMLNEAKRYGRNRTFYQEGDYPAPVVPPALEIEGQRVRL